ncbi:MAG: phosphatidylserine/phosphatidylglycerophosphate/cardiolipin synthase family protein [Clostridia bacterium]|nr:phosphatidylserine/phosphatidylglycerophosphate/cardiolipin synthase family protein [Clostridia bacterium]
MLIAAETAAIIFLCLYIPAVMPVTAAFAAVWLFTLITVAAAISRGLSPEVNCALALFIIALPVAGAVIYLIASARQKKCGALKIMNANPENGLEAAAYSICGVCAAGYDKAEYFTCGGEYFTRLIRVIEKAKESVYLEYFIISRGKVFARLLEALNAAKSNGAEIKIIVDGVGSAFKSGRKELKKLKKLGEVKIFHRLKPLPYSRLNFRDHRKIAVIDGYAAFTGGINIADEYANIKNPYGFWKDTAVAVYGSAAKIFEGMFLSLWHGKYEMPAPEGGNERCLPFYDCPPNRPSFAESAFLTAISSASEKVHIMTPYFCVSEKLFSALEFAARRGVDVRIILPHIPDKKYAFELSKACAERLMPSGVKFYEYTPGFMHAKTMVCDGGAYIGSYNFDFRSMRLNCECGLFMRGEIAERIERDIWECLRVSEQMKKVKLSPFRKALRFFLKLLAPLM